MLQRHPAFWEHPEQFDPERYTPVRATGRHRFAYFPFRSGLRRCIDQNLAMLEMLVILAMMAQEYELRLVPGHPVEPDALMTLRPRHGILMALRHRRDWRLEVDGDHRHRAVPAMEMTLWLPQAKAMLAGIE